MRDHYWRMLAYSPYFDARLSWFPDAWAYKDLYAIYADSGVASAHPDWVLRDPSGAPLYIPFDCHGGSCPQYAADVGNAAFRSQWIAEARATLARGYRGLFVDDVNLTLTRVSEGRGTPVVPRDPRTGAPMTETAWRGYMATFLEQIRTAFPTIEIGHNALWSLGHADPAIQRAVQAADWIVIERGVNDDGIRGGSGTFGFDILLAHIDWIHQRGKAVVFDALARSRRDREYGLAAYFLVGGGNDALGNPKGGTPDRRWWPAYDGALGAPLGARYVWRGVLRRDFERGIVLVNPPDARTTTLFLDGAYRNWQGRPRRVLALRPASGTVLWTVSP